MGKIKQKRSKLHTSAVKPSAPNQVKADDANITVDILSKPKVSDNNLIINQTIKLIINLYPCGLKAVCMNIYKLYTLNRN